MAIAFTAAGTAKKVGSGNLASTALPAGFSADDIFVCCVTATDNVTVTFPAGWTKKLELNSGTFLRQTIAWRRAVAGDAAFTITHTGGNSTVARVYGFSGCITSGDPFEDAQSQATAGSKTITAPDCPSASAATSMDIFVGSAAVNADTSNTMTVASYSGTDPTYTERGDDNVVTGANYGQQAIATGLRSASGAPGSKTALITTAFAAGNVNNIGAQLTLIDAAGGGATPTVKNLAALGVG